MIGSKKWSLPNGDVLTTSYDGEKLVITVKSGNQVVFLRKLSNLDLTGDPIFIRGFDSQPVDTLPRTGRFSGGVHLGFDE